jgi:hypothetical protein
VTLAKKVLVPMLLLAVGSAALLLSRLRDDNTPVPMSLKTARRLDLSGYADSAPGTPLRLLFIHHSCGGQLLAEAGPDVGTNAIYTTHPNGGGLRRLMEKAGYEVHEAAYGSKVGEHTDVFDWLPKFRQQMGQVLACDRQDTAYADGRQNQVVVFKSCFPNNQFVAAGTPPGNPTGPELTVWNAMAAYSGLLGEFRKYPQVLFVCVTAPPIAPAVQGQPLWKQVAKKILGRASSPAASAALARQFNDWLSGDDGWLKGGGLTNVVVFDYYDMLTDCGASNLSCYATDGGRDSHPSRAGNEKAAVDFMSFLNRAVRRAGLVQQAVGAGG